MIIILIELAAMIVLGIASYIALSGDLWDQVYIDHILEDWNKGPIVEMKQISQIDKEDGELLFDDGDECPDDFEPIAQAHWFGFNIGCSCHKHELLPE